MNPRKTNVFLAIIASKMAANGKIILLYFLSRAAQNARNELRLEKPEATHERIAKDCSMSVPTVQRQMKQLLRGAVVLRGGFYQLAIKTKATTK